MSVLFHVVVGVFFTTAGQIPIVRVLWLYLVIALYSIIFLSAEYWGIEDPEEHKMMQALFIPAGFIIAADLIIDAISDTIAEIFNGTKS
jgi:hypothetical protein